MIENEYDVDDNCTGCYFDEGVVRDEWHGTCGMCGFSVVDSIIDAMYDDFKMGR